MTADLSVPSSTGSIHTPPRTGLVLSALILAAFLAILNETVLTIALPQLMVDFAIPATTAQWLTTGFMLTMAIVIPATGFLLGRFTRRALFITAMLFFLSGTALAAVATGFEMMLIARIVQAVGTAITMPLLMSTTMMLVAPARRGVVLGLNQVVIAVGPAIGPTLAGVVMHALDWRWIFILMLPLGVAILIFGVFTVRVPLTASTGSLDVWSVILSAFAFGGVVYALASIGVIIEGSIPASVAGLVGIAALVLFVIRQRKLVDEGREPLLDLRAFSVSVFSRSVIVVGLAFGTMIGTVVVLPIYLQDGRELDVLTAGLLMLPAGAVQAIAAPLLGAVFDKHGSRPLLVPGALLLTAGSWLLATAGATTPLTLVVVFHMVFILGLSAVMTALMTGAMGSLPPQQYGHGSAILSTVQQLAGALGTALMITALGLASTGEPISAAVTSGTRAAFVVGGIMTLVALVFAFTIKIKPVHRQP